MHVLTLDIEGWFHLLDIDTTKTEKEWNNFETRIHGNVDRLLDLLNEKNQKATCFCLGWVAEKYPEVIKKIDSSGHEIGSHSYYHQLAYSLDKDGFERDLKESIDRLEQCIGKKVRSFRVPGFSFTPETVPYFHILYDAGISLDSSIFPAPRGHGGFPGFGAAEPAWIEYEGVRIKEFPINVYKKFGRKLVFSGGGYFRLFPYFLLRWFFKNAPYVMTYFHPRDFDWQQPVVPGLSVPRRFKSYVGLKSALKKLSRLIDDFSLVDLNTADRMVQWENAKVVKLS